MEELAIIKDIHVGMRDINKVICWFTVETLNYSSLQIISLFEMDKMLLEGSVYKLEDLNNRPCIVTINDGLCKFKKLK